MDLKRQLAVVMLFIRYVSSRHTYQGGCTVNLCTIDLSKAFDKVNHHGLFIKLIKRKIPVKLLNILESLFSQCYSCVKWDNLMSAFFGI